MTYIEAGRRAVAEALAADPAVIALGEGVGWAESESLLVAAGITASVGLAGAVLAGRLPGRLRHPDEAEAGARELPPVDLPP